MSDQPVQPDGVPFDTVPFDAVPFDAEVAAALGPMEAADAVPMTQQTIPMIRASATTPPTLEVVGDAPVEVVETTAPGPPGAPDIELTMLRPHGIDHPVPALYNMHGGGMMLGSRHMDADRLLGLVLELGVTAVNVEYRLAPENPHPASVEDCYAGLTWMSGQAAELQIDPDRVVCMGGSAGGGLAAAVALMARDRGGPQLAGQLLLCPMIDDSNTSASSYQYSGLGPWTREANIAGWSALLGHDVGTAAVSPYAAASRATDLSGLPPAFIEVGSAEPFRDEDTDYALRIWATGGQAELHVWSGASHGFDIFAPDAQVTSAALATRTSWLKRVLSL